MNFVGKVFILSFLFVCVVASDAMSQKGKNNKKAADLVVIDASKRHQTIDNFGASDCWQAQYVGKHSSDEVKNQVADLLFSTGFDSSGRPKGIGLSLWRFNIGAGSREQGRDRDFKDWASSGVSSTECLLSEDGVTYDWTKQSGERWFLRAAKERGVDQFLAFTNSPPYFMTTNHKTHYNGVSAKNYNLAPDKREAYAEFLCKVVDGIEKNDGVRFDYISPFNEPEWEWKDGVQEGTPATNSDIAEIVRILDAKLTAHKLDNSKIIICESAKYDSLFCGGDQGNHIDQFFDKSSANYIGNLKHVAPIITGHSYWTTVPDTTLISTRKKLHDKLVSAGGLQFWQTEFCMLEQDPIVGPVAGADTTIKLALHVAKVIHNDIVVAGAKAWHWWLGMSAWNNKDGLVALRGDLTKGTVKVVNNKTLWAMGSFSRFVRPGSVRIDVSGDRLNDPQGLMVSAYLDPESGSIVVVAINYGWVDRSFPVRINGVKLDKMIPYVTSDRPDENMTPKSAVNVRKITTLDVPSRSIVTFVGK